MSLIKKKTKVAKRLEKHLSKRQIATFLQSSRSQKPSNKQSLKDEALKGEILEIRKEHKNYGVERLAIALDRAESVVHRVVKKYTLQIKRKRKHIFKPDDIGFKATDHKCLTKNLVPIVPNEVWASDFTYLKFQGRMYYFATFIDIFSRKIQGWNFSDSHDTELILGALRKAVDNAGSKPSICHSDQGSEYRSQLFPEVLETSGIRCSMSPKASPWRNGFQELFYAGFKNDLGDINRFNCLCELIEAIALTIKKYNSRRIHTALKTSPDQFLNNFYDKKCNVKTGSIAKVISLEKVVP